MEAASFERRAFINCPFDEAYLPLFHAIVFTLLECGIAPRCALETDDGGEIRRQKIERLIRETKYGIHDISRTELDRLTHLPRMNMPLELGLELGARCYGGSRALKSKRTLVLDRDHIATRSF